MQSRFDPIKVVRLRRILKSLSPDAVHYHGTRAAFYGAVGNIISPRWKTVYTAHGLAFRKETSLVRKQAFSLAESLACRGADHVVSVSSSDLAELQDRGYLPLGGTYIPNAVDTDIYSPGDRDESRALLSLSRDAFVVGTVSRLVPQKGVEWLIEAMAYCPDMELVLIGDGELRAELEAKAGSELKRIHFCGARNDVPHLLAAFDIFALSSLWEGQPIALLEALAAGIPCVATSTEGSMEVLREIRGGLIVPKCDPEGLAGAFQRLRSNSELRKKLAAAAREGALLRSHGATVESLLNVYRSIGSVNVPN